MKRRSLRDLGEHVSDQDELELRTVTLVEDELGRRRIEKAHSTADVGPRQTYSTGSVRQSAVGKGRYDLLPASAVARIARLIERGASKYGDRNWEKGQPLSRYLDSALRHTFQLLDHQRDEDHAAAAAWNLLAFLHTAERIAAGTLPAELDDNGWTAP